MRTFEPTIVARGTLGMQITLGLSIRAQAEYIQGRFLTEGFREEQVLRVAIWERH